MQTRKWVLLFPLLFCTLFMQAQKKKKPVSKAPAQSKPIIPGAYWTAKYVPQLKDKRVAVFANNTSRIGKMHLIDTLRSLGINIVTIFAPEHGFRGTAAAGEHVTSYKDETTGIPVVSLYGKKMKPSAEDLKNVDVILFDVQDVGVRFYTYISSLQLLMESAIEHNKTMFILDRPNPNGHYVDGPVLDTDFKSFVGMQPVPLVYGMTIGEYAHMLIGEGWLSTDIMTLVGLRMVDGTLSGKDSSNGGINITVIKCRNYTHKTRYVLPDKPSPNLPDANAIAWYPSTGLFEGTVLSEGRGTAHPFQIFGHPALPKTLFSFTPSANEGAPKPKLMNQLCYGWNVATTPPPSDRLELKYLLEAYRLFPDKAQFFILPKKDSATAKEIFFNKLAGNSTLMQQIKEGKTAEEIRASWKPAIDRFLKIRKRYLLYED